MPSSVQINSIFLRKSKGIFRIKSSYQEYITEMMALQEHSLYDDAPSRYSKPSDNMYLNLKEGKRHSILTTPDVSVFALSTPEVQNILSTSGNATTISTATRRTPTTPSSYGLLRGDQQVTVEQEYYAKGFLDRLEALQAGDIHRNKNVHNPSVVSCSNHTSSSHFSNGPNPSLEAVAPTYVTATLDHIPNFASATQTISETTSSYPMSTSHDGYYTHDSYSMPFRHETAVLPGAYSMPSTMTGGIALAQPLMYGVTDGSHMNGNMMKEMTMVPPEMHVQEQMKVERKKARNRIAASKCREKRLQREADLQSKVKILKEHNKELNDEVNGLREQISNLKRALLQHMKTGCQVNIPEHLHSNGERS